MAKNMKRIHKVTIKRMADESPDTSWLGEYSNDAKTEYAIDRAHDLDCPQQSYNRPAYALGLLENIMQHLRNVKDAHCSTVKNRTDEQKAHDLDIWSDYDDAEDICIDANTEIKEECNCAQGGRWDNREYRYFNGCVENYKGESPDTAANWRPRILIRATMRRNRSRMFYVRFERGRSLSSLAYGTSVLLTRGPSNR